jgi:hypothetical protein
MKSKVDIFTFLSSNFFVYAVGTEKVRAFSTNIKFPSCIIGGENSHEDHFKV